MHPSAKPAPPREVETIAWAARQLGVSLRTAYRLAGEGALPGLVRLGSTLRVSVPRFREAVHGEALAAGRRR
jgi:excisionase family DNA binding protein